MTRGMGMTDRPVNKKPPFWKRKYLIYPKFQATLILLNAMVILTSFLMVGVLLKIQKQAYVQQGQEEGAPSVYAHFLDMYFSDTVNYLIVATVISLTATSLFTLFYPIESQAQFTVWSAFSARPRQLPPFQRPCVFGPVTTFKSFRPSSIRRSKSLKKKSQIRVLSRSSDTRSAEPIAST